VIETPLNGTTTVLLPPLTPVALANHRAELPVVTGMTASDPSLGFDAADGPAHSGYYGFAEIIIIPAVAAVYTE
jgi:hypothetical protein